MKETTCNCGFGGRLSGHFRWLLGFNVLSGLLNPQEVKIPRHRHSDKADWNSGYLLGKDVWAGSRLKTGVGKGRQQEREKWGSHGPRTSAGRGSRNVVEMADRAKIECLPQ